ncbi:MAG: CDGSH iron-sulfur domain-containing protein [Verrucomicrobiota bacterium]
MSEQPIICDRKPTVLEVETGTHWWCSCGHSANQPFCDGAHKGSSFRPVKFEALEKKSVALCLCKHSANPPFCDGAHKSLPAAE